eukprot:9307096-Heterocapsa_arctica.AAC.1
MYTNTTTTTTTAAAAAAAAAAALVQQLSMRVATSRFYGKNPSVSWSLGSSICCCYYASDNMLILI